MPCRYCYILMRLKSVMLYPVIRVDINLVNLVCRFINNYKYTYVGIFYYTLANLNPALRSTHQCIQLIAVVTSSILHKHGFEITLRPFVDDVNKLYTVSTSNIFL